MAVINTVCRTALRYRRQCTREESTHLVYWSRLLMICLLSPEDFQRVFSPSKIFFFMCPLLRLSCGFHSMLCEEITESVAQPILGSFLNFLSNRFVDCSLPEFCVSDVVVSNVIPTNHVIFFEHMRF